MLTSFSRNAIHSPATNRGHLVWVPWFAELKAIWLLAKLGLEVIRCRAAR